MAMSLEELLAVEGFRGRRSKTMPKASSGTDEKQLKIYPPLNQQKSGSLSGLRKTGRTKSVVYQYNEQAESAASDRSRKTMDSLIRSCRASEDEIAGNRESQHSDYLEKTKPERDNEVSDIWERNNQKYKEVYLNEVYSDEGREGKHGSRKDIKQKYGKSSKKNIDNSEKCLSGSTSSNGFKERIKQLESSYSISGRSSIANKTFDENIRSNRREVIEQSAAAPALDEAAVKAVVSIFSGYIKSFLEDEDFRTSLYHDTFASLNFVGQEEGLNTESKVMENLEQAIETVERAAEEYATVKELKRATLQLSVIAGLNSDDLKDGYTSGIPNFKLSACAHLYLAVTYKIQKKDKLAAKHLLQVFCVSPSQARSKLLTNLWEHVFWPHLLHLKVWYDNESALLKDSPIKDRRLRILEKTYNEILDSGTRQLAKYYKNWLTKGVETPPFTSIQIPSKAVWLVQQESLCSQSPDSKPLGRFHSQPIVSKKLYDAVFAHSQKSGVEIEDFDEENFAISARSSVGATDEEKLLFGYNSLGVWSTEQDIDHEGESYQSDVKITEEDQRKQLAITPEELYLDEIDVNCINGIQVQRATVVLK